MGPEPAPVVQRVLLGGRRGGGGEGGGGGGESGITIGAICGRWKGGIFGSFFFQDWAISIVRPGPEKKKKKKKR